MITALCNVFIDSPDKLNLFKESLLRVGKASDEWLVYVRGRYSVEAVKYARDVIKKNNGVIIVFNNLSEDHWAKSSLKMLEKASHEYVYVFLEDHLLLRSVNKFKGVVSQAIQRKIDYFSYSFFNVGLGTDSVEALYPDEDTDLFTFGLTEALIPFLKKHNPKFYPISLAGVFSLRKLKTLLEVEACHKIVLVPFFMQALMQEVFFSYPRNRAFWARINRLSQKIGLRFVIYPPKTPFNLERSLFDVEESMLPFKVGILKKELFANWDDDNDVANSSLLKRGLYPLQLKVFDSGLEKGSSAGKTTSIAQGQVVARSYYPCLHRLSSAPLKSIKVIRGTIRIAGLAEQYVLNSGDEIVIYANIPHILEGLRDSEYYFEILPEKR